MISEERKDYIESIIKKRLKNITQKLKIGFFKHKYSEKHRHYHNWNHILDLINKSQYKDILSDDLLLSILFHDIVYLPINNDNEKQSAEIFKIYFPNNIDVYNSILSTKTHTSTDILSKYLNELDMSILYTDNLTDFIDYEKGISKEFSFVNKDVYLIKRIEFLTNNNVSEKYIDYVKYLNK
jgi:predicted metal-dependent HD superfamily phosphohydrolase